MPVAFEQVSYTYVDPKSRKKKERRKLFGRKGEAGASTRDERAAWGTAPDAVWALSDVSFCIEDGEFFGIAGHTGSGKSTLIQHMNGLVRPTCGRVLFDGEDLADKAAAARARAKCGLVFQYPEHQLFAASVYEDVAFGPRNMGVPEDEVDGRVRAALAQVGLDFEAVAQRSPFELSGGQQRRVAFAGVLAMEPKVLVLDEPVAGLDPKARAEFLALIRQLHQSGLTVVMVSHCMDDLAALCDRILVLKEGAQFMLGTPAEVFADPALLKSVGLGAPAAQSVALNLRERGFALPRMLYDAETLADDLAVELGVGDARNGSVPDASGKARRVSAADSAHRGEPIACNGGASVVADVPAARASQ